MTDESKQFDPLVRKLEDASSRLADVERRQGTARLASRAAWKTPSLENDWVNRSGCETFGYTLDNDGVVHFRGVIQSGVLGSEVTDLPEELRPPMERYIPIAASGGVAALRITTTGSVIPEDLTGSSTVTWCSLTGACYDRQGYRPDTVPMGAKARSGDYSVLWPVPHARTHLGGLVLAGGLGKFYGSPASGEEVFSVASDQGSLWQYAFTTISAGPGSAGYARHDLIKQNFKWKAGVPGTIWASYDGMTWPSARMYNDRQSLTLGSGVTQFTLSAEPWSPQLSVFKDDMGFCWVGGIVNITNVSAGSVVGTLPADYRPTTDCIVPCTNNNVAASLRIKPNGDVTLEAAGAAAFLAVGHGYWLDN